MKWVWNSSNKTLEKPLGYNPCGLQYGGKRPDNLILSTTETHDVFSFSEEKFNSYVVQKLSKSLLKC